MNTKTTLTSIKVNQLTKSFQTESGKLPILTDVSFCIERSSSIAICGASGSGKTTLLGILAGLDTPTSGEVFLIEQPLHEMDEEQKASLRKNQVGFIFQSFHLLPALTAIENVMLPLELENHPDAKTRAQDLLDKVGLSERANHYPTALSGGEQQRVAIARAFVTEPNIIFADEPTGNLDDKTSKQVVELMFQLNRDKGTTLVIVTHDQALAALCDHHYVLTNGVLNPA